MSDLYTLTLMHPCTYCGAGVDQPCQTQAGKRYKAFLHSDRYWPIEMAWKRGYQMGRTAGYEKAHNDQMDLRVQDQLDHKRDYVCRRRQTGPSTSDWDRYAMRPL